jgi:two-component system chemotaxis response regulator CheY
MSYVLIVDDSALARMIVRRSLSAAGFADAAMQEAPDGAAALALVKQRAPQFIVADVNMPNMTGDELLAQLALSPELAAIPVIMCSSAVNDAMVARLSKLGARAVLKKPFSPAELHGALRGAIGRAA